jgi:hypothetical protein
MKKLLLLTGAAVGYVLGTRAGRERYEQMKSKAQGFAKDPRVQQKAREATTAVKENAPVVKDKVAGAAGTAKAAAQEKLDRSGGDVDSSRSSTAASSTPYPQG